MRHQDQINDDHPDVVKSEPVPVPPPGDDADRAEAGYDDPDRFDGPEGDRPGFRHQAGNRESEDVLDDGGSFDDPSVRDDALTGHPDATARTGDDDLVDGEPVPGDRMDDHDETGPAIDEDRQDDGNATGRAGDDDDRAGLMDDTRRVDEPVGDDLDRTEFHEPAPQPTTFGAATVGGAAAAAAMAGDRRATEHDVDELDADRSRDGVVDDRLANDRLDETRLDNDRLDDDRLDDDRTGTVADGGTAAAVGGVAAATAAGTAVDGQPGDGVAPAGGLLPGAVPAEPVTALLGRDAAQGFRDRWRDVQLRFVDDPKAAVGEAQGLVDEAIEALASALSGQKNELGSWQSGDSGDTEQLRVVVRRYRDFLDRVLGL